MGYKWRIVVAAWAVVLITMGHARAQDRMPPIPAHEMSDEQKRAVEEFQRVRRTTRLPLSFATLLRSPEVMVSASTLGEYLRRSSLPTALYEFVVMLTARQLDQQYVWDGHYQPAIDAGVSATILQDLAEGRVPSFLSDDQVILFDLLEELHRTNRVSDRTYERAVNRFGEKGVVDAITTNGFYTMIGRVMSAAQTPAVGGAPQLLVPR